MTFNLDPSISIETAALPPTTLDHILYAQALHMAMMITGNIPNLNAGGDNVIETALEKNEPIAYRICRYILRKNA